MLPNRLLALLLLVAAVSAAAAVPVASETALRPATVRPNVGDMMNKEIGKASRTFSTSRTVVIAIIISVVAVLAAILCCCLVRFCKFMK